MGTDSYAFLAWGFPLDSDERPWEDYEEVEDEEVDPNEWMLWKLEVDDYKKSPVEFIRTGYSEFPEFFLALWSVTQEASNDDGPKEINLKMPTEWDRQDFYNACQQLEIRFKPPKWHLMIYTSF